MSVRACIPAMFPKRFLVFPVIAFFEYFTVRRIHISVVFPATRFAVGDQLQGCVESFLQVFRASILVGLQTGFCQKAESGLLGWSGSRGMIPDWQPFGCESQVGQDDFFVDSHRVGADRRVVEAGFRFRKHGYPSELFHCVEVIDSSHEAGFGNFRIPFLFCGVGRLVA